MITEETINKIYSYAIRSNQLTSKELIANGLNYNDINKLINQEIIKRIKPGYYEIASVEKLYQHGLKLLLERKNNLAILCFKKCYEIDPTHRNAILRLFYTAITEKNYPKAFELLNTLYNFGDPEYQKENNLYLYLLNFIVPCEERYIERVKSITIDDLLPEQKNNDEFEYIIRKIFSKNIKQARKDLQSYIDRNTDNSIKIFILKELINKIFLYERDINQKLLELAISEDYFELEKILSIKRKTRSYKAIDAYALSLTYKIDRMIFAKEIPYVTTLDTNNLYDAIKGNNFGLALELNLQYIKERQMSEENILTILLKKATELASKLKEENELQTSVVSDEEEKESEETIIPEPVEQKANPQEPVEVATISNTVITEEENDTIIEFVDLIPTLLNNDIEKFSELLNQYLKQKGKEEYEYLIIRLIKLSILDGDNTFLNPITTLVEIDKNLYSFNVSLYIQEFYISLAEHKLDKSQIYLEIISRYFSNSQSIIDNLSKSLEKEKSDQTKELQAPEETIINVPKRESKEIIQSTDSQISKPSIKAETKQQIISQNTSSNGDSIEEERKRLLDRIKIMKERHEGIVLYKNIPEDRRRSIHMAAKSIPELTTFSIGEESKSIILRYINPNAEPIDIKSHLCELEESYKNKKYVTYIRMARKLLEYPQYSEFRGYNYARVYAKLGISYLCINDKKEAIKCFIIANGLDEKSPKRIYDFSKQIEKLKSREQVSEEDKKTSPPMKVEDFQDDLDDNFGIKNIQTIADYIRVENLSIEEGCRKFRLTEDRILLVKLIYARDYYTEENYVSGDRLLVEVERSRHKTNRVIKMLNEIRRNKMFYKNRINAHTRKRI